MKKKNFFSKYVQSISDQEKSLLKLEQHKDVINSRYSSYDLWNDQNQHDNEKDPEIKKIEHQQKALITAHQTKMPVYHLEKRSLLPAVEIPHPGASYNPSIQDHQELLKKAHLVEVQKKKEEEHLQRVVGKYMRRNKRQLEKERLKEMSCGLNLNGNESETEANKNENSKEDESEQDLVCPKSKIIRAENRKLKSVRRTEKLRKLEEEKRDKVKRQKSLESQVNQIKKLKKEILAEEKKSQERIEKRKKRKEQRKYEPAKLGPHKYEPPEIELNLSSQLSGNLRNLKTEGLLFEDRIKSLQRRNLIEPRKKVSKKSKTKIKLYEKRSRSM